jgi:hypothetical protein
MLQSAKNWIARRRQIAHVSPVHLEAWESKPVPNAAIGSMARRGRIHQASPPDVAGAPMSSHNPSNIR